MKLIIDIDDEVYNEIKNKGQGKWYCREMDNAIRQGTPLPEGHGKIVDLGNIDKDRIEQDNPVMTINIYGTAIEAVPLDYLYNLPDLLKKEGE